MGVGFQGGEVLFTCPIKTPLNPPLLQECHAGSPWDKLCICVWVYAYVLCLLLSVCGLLFAISDFVSFSVQ